MPTAHEWRQHDRDRADADLLRRAAVWLREDPQRARHVGLSHDGDGHAVAVLLEILATGITSLDSAVRGQAVESCRVLLGEAGPHDVSGLARHEVRSGADNAVTRPGRTHPE